MHPRAAMRAVVGVWVAGVEREVIGRVRIQVAANARRISGFKSNRSILLPLRNPDCNAVTLEAPRPTNVVNLMDALRKSIQSEKDVASKKAPSKTSAARPGAKGAKEPGKARKAAS
jgi:hypothetical protein